ncbi:hypothetical protein ATE47_07925 [Chryseobacterium sp. IHB B 17019]|uniref:hypothetical protein n=1 Tax=Chryseobacterium sp. IHB B 17019 TaxID=1721091 RepID=UPI00071EFE99|nr:hypothetical protein [Chryseobacterium sp. IHB B 17019]ALR30458.1 hypothetical protein ATE47_07925 [Chryseobacterium sp. IHB B 17019]
MNYFFRSYFPLSALAIFFISGCGGKAAAARNKKNELKQMLQSGLDFLFLISNIHNQFNIQSVILKRSQCNFKLGLDPSRMTTVRKTTERFSSTSLFRMTKASS